MAEFFFSNKLTRRRRSHFIHCHTGADGQQSYVALHKKKPPHWLLEGKPYRNHLCVYLHDELEASSQAKHIFGCFVAYLFIPKART